MGKLDGLSPDEIHQHYAKGFGRNMGMAALATAVIAVGGDKSARDWLKETASKISSHATSALGRTASGLFHQTNHNDEGRDGL